MDNQIETSAADRPRTGAVGRELLRVVVALTLLVAAALKSYGLMTGSLAQDSFVASLHVQIVAIEVEILLGLWLLSGQALRVAWVAAIGFFAIMAGVSLYLALDGQQSCGCAGPAITISPWLTFAFDVAVTAALVVWRPARSPETRSAAWLRGALQTGLGAAAFLALIGGAILLATDDPIGALARLRGDFISVEPGTIHVGDGVAGEQRTITVHLTNHENRPIRIIGGSATCSCIATGDLPITLPPGESRPIGIRVTFLGKAGRFQHSFLLYADDKEQPITMTRFTGRVIESPTP